MKKYILLTLIMCTLTAHAQYDRVDFYTPDASSLMRYVDYPVGHITGIPDIRIPLHTIEVSGHKIPIELSFHLDNYMRSNQYPGCAGAGWSLSTDFQITRVINGLDDFSAAGYYNSMGYKPAINYTGEFVNKTQREKVLMHLGRNEEDPDKFYYKIAGKSGAFYLQKDEGNHKYRCVNIPMDGVKIIMNNTGEFTIVNTDGVTYHFKSMDISFSESSSLPGNVTLSWRCYKVTYPSGDVINLTYISPSTAGYSSHENIFNGRLELYDNQQDHTRAGSSWEPKCDDDGQAYRNVPFWKIMGPKMSVYRGWDSNQIKFFKAEGYFSDNYTYPIGGQPARSIVRKRSFFLSQMSFRGGKILLEYDSKYVLKVVKILNNANNVVKTITLTQKEVGLSTSLNNAIEYTRTLDKLKINDEEYSFEYGYQRKGCVQADYWGYEGSSAGDEAIPEQKVEVLWGTVKGTMRDFINCEQINNFNQVTRIGASNIFSIRNGISLLKINYPTGGMAEFIVERNRFRASNPDPISDQRNDVRGAGGYRIERIKYYETKNSSPVRERIYKYGPNEDGTGKIKREPDFNLYNPNTYSEQKIAYYTESGLIQTIRKRTFPVGGIGDSGFENGSPINYSEVAVYESDMGINTGKTIYKFDVANFSAAYASPTDPSPFAPEEWSVGMPVSVTSYRYNQNTRLFDWENEKTYQYQKYVHPIRIFRGKVYATTVPIDLYGAASESFYESSMEVYYKYDGLKTGCMQLAKETNKFKDKNGSIVTEETNYHYDNPNHYTPNRIEKTMSDGNEFTEQTTYAQDYLRGGFVSSLLDKNMVEFPIEKIKRNNGLVVQGELYKYNTNGTIASVNMLEGSITEAAFRMSNKSTAGQYTAATANAAFSADSRYVQKYTMTYDNYLNIKSVVPDGTYPVVYLWSYNGQYPVAEIKNATYTVVNTALATVGLTSIDALASNANPDKTKLDQLRTVLSGSLITTYKYKPLVGVIESTSPDGINIYYDYDSNGRLKEKYWIEVGVRKTIQTYTYNHRQ